MTALEPCLAYSPGLTRRSPVDLPHFESNNTHNPIRIINILG